MRIIYEIRSDAHVETVVRPVLKIAINLVVIFGACLFWEMAE